MAGRLPCRAPSSQRRLSGVARGESAPQLAVAAEPQQGGSPRLDSGQDL